MSKTELWDFLLKLLLLHHALSQLVEPPTIPLPTPTAINQLVLSLICPIPATHNPSPNAFLACLALMASLLAFLAPVLAPKSILHTAVEQI